MSSKSPQGRLVAVIRKLAIEKGAYLARLKADPKEFARPDFIWHYLLQSFATMGRASGHKGLIENQENYGRVTYVALESLSDAARGPHVHAVCRAAGIRMPDKKAGYILGCFDRVRQLGGPEATKAQLCSQVGRDAKIRFLEQFPGIGPKYARNIMMDVYHEDFRDSIAVDSRIKGISKVLGLSFPAYAEEETFYLEVARIVGINGWELDRLLFNFKHEVESRLAL